MTSNPDLIVQSAYRHVPAGLDPLVFARVCISMASSEGSLKTPAEEGDYGYAGWGSGTPTSYGPFQAHWTGACPKYVVINGAQALLWGNVNASQAWANSPEGIDYGVALIAGAMNGATEYHSAITNGVRFYERPARPDPEIAKDIAYYETSTGWVKPPVPQPPAFPVFPGQMSPHQGNGPSIAELKKELAKLGFPSDNQPNWTPATSKAVIALKQSHDLLLYLDKIPYMSGEYWGKLVQTGPGKYKSTYTDTVGVLTWAYMAWLSAVNKVK